jgi:hypothetical protein
MTAERRRALEMGAIILVVILTGAGIGALLGYFRVDLGGSPWAVGAMAGSIASAVGIALKQCRSRALEDDRRP